MIKDVGFDFDWSNEKVWRLDVPVTEMDIEELTWHFDVPFHRNEGVPYALTSREIIENPDKYAEEYERTMRSELKYPIDIMENKGRWLILDGLHRLMKAYIQGARRVNVRMIPREKISEILPGMTNERIGRCSAVIIRGGRILLIRRIKPGEDYYVFPGGGVEEGESFEEAMIREIKEELNLTAAIDRELFRLNDAERGENRFFLIRDFQGELKLGGPEAERASERNQFIPEWMEARRIAEAGNVYPEEAAKKLSESLTKDRIGT